MSAKEGVTPTSLKKAIDISRKGRSLKVKKLKEIAELADKALEAWLESDKVYRKLKLTKEKSSEEYYDAERKERQDRNEACQIALRMVHTDGVTEETIKAVQQLAKDFPSVTEY